MKDIHEGLGSGYINELGVKCMIRCFKCGTENYAPVVNTGRCAWCTHNPNSLKDNYESIQSSDPNNETVE